MPGTRTNANATHGLVIGYTTAVVTAALNLNEHRILFPCYLRAVKGSGETAGTGGGNTVLDVLKNGTSIWTTGTNRPTLLATSTGEFASTVPDTRAFVPGDLLTLQVATVSTTGHARVSLAVALEIA